MDNGNSTFIEYADLDCLGDPVLCDAGGRCPRCTAIYHARCERMLRKEKAQMLRAMREVSCALRKIVRESLRTDQPDFDHLRALVKLADTLTVKA